MANAIRNTLILFFFVEKQKTMTKLCAWSLHTADICLTRMKGFKITCSFSTAFIVISGEYFREIVIGLAISTLLVASLYLAPIGC